MSDEDKYIVMSESDLDKCLENAKQWCQKNLNKYLPRFMLRDIDYNIFRYEINNELSASMSVHPDGLIKVSPRTLGYITSAKFKEKQIDFESMFIHEIVEWILIFKHNEKNQSLLKRFMIRKFYSKLCSPHLTARSIENIKRKEIGLKDW